MICDLRRSALILIVGTSIFILQILKRQIKTKHERRKRIKSSESVASDFRKRIRDIVKPKRRGSRPRSGYAFSQERGFGDLISSGRMSSRRRKNAENQAQNAAAAHDKTKSATADPLATGTYRTIET